MSVVPPRLVRWKRTRFPEHGECLCSAAVVTVAFPKDATGLLLHPPLCGPFGSGGRAGLSTLLGALCLRFGTYSSASKSLLIRLGKIMRGYCAVVKEKVLTTKAQRTQRVFCK